MQAILGAHSVNKHPCDHQRRKRGKSGLKKQEEPTCDRPRFRMESAGYLTGNVEQRIQRQGAEKHDHAVSQTRLDLIEDELQREHDELEAESEAVLDENEDENEDTAEEKKTDISGGFGDESDTCTWMKPRTKIMASV